MRDALRDRRQARAGRDDGRGQRVARRGRRAASRGARAIACGSSGTPRTRATASPTTRASGCRPGRYHLVVNPDVRLPPGTIGRLIHALDTLPGAGLVGPLASMDDAGRRPPAAERASRSVARGARGALAHVSGGRGLSRAAARPVRVQVLALGRAARPRHALGRLLPRKAIHVPRRGTLRPAATRSTTRTRTSSAASARTACASGTCPRSASCTSSRAPRSRGSRARCCDTTCRRAATSKPGSARRARASTTTCARGRTGGGATPSRPGPTRISWRTRRLASTSPTSRTRSSRSRAIRSSRWPRGCSRTAPGPFEIPAGFFSGLGPGTYWIRTVDPASGDTIRAWRIRKTSAAGVLVA